LSSSADAGPCRLDGLDAGELARRLALPRVALFDAVTSTLDVAHVFAADGASAGTLIIADEQTSGRGRHGRRWTSAPGAGLWMALIERPTDARALDVLALRCGLYAAEALQPLAPAPIGVKWPNDLYLSARKLAGILIETRWRGTSPDWVAIGFGLNVAAPAVDLGIGLAPGTSRLAALDRLGPSLRRAAAMSGALTADELQRWQSRDIAARRFVSEPAVGRALGITPSGELLIEAPDGTTTTHRSGSLTLAEPLACS
jgi:BirA family biotin operon repressor/biotin-[acetyl-CoA-carboxylase] ligase